MYISRGATERKLFFNKSDNFEIFIYGKWCLVFSATEFNVLSMSLNTFQACVLPGSKYIPLRAM